MINTFIIRLPCLRLLRNAVCGMGLLCTSTMLPNLAHAFETSSFSSAWISAISASNSPGAKFRKDAQVELISSSFNDTFSRIDFGTTATQARFLEAPKSVDADQIRRNINDQFGYLPVEQRRKIEDVYIRAKEADEILKAKSTGTAVPDDVKILYGEERERLLTKIHDFEVEMQTARFKATKPVAYDRFSRSIDQFGEEYDNADTCIRLSFCKAEAKARGEGPSLPDKSAALKKIGGALIQAPVEITSPEQQTLKPILENIDERTKSLSAYIDNLYAKKS